MILKVELMIWKVTETINFKKIMKEKTETILTTDLRNSLKELFRKELIKFPGYINQLQPKDKMDYLLKMMPYILPKLQNVNLETGEPGEYEIKMFK